MAVFDGKEGGRITLAEGAALTEAFRNRYSGQPIARFFGITNLQSILNQSGCKGIRMYFGEDTSGQLQLVLCGADENGNDMLNVIVDLSVGCPSICGSSNDLNS